MIYAIGANLERESLRMTLNLLSIMEGIWLFEKETGLKSQVRFFVETGGSCLDPEKSITGNVSPGARKERINILDNFEEIVKARILGNDFYSRTYERLKTILKISWEKNERWELTANEIKLSLSSPSEDGNLLMTQKDNSGRVRELFDFVKSVRSECQAQQELLFIFAHGGGPLWGLGEDERNDDENIFPADLVTTIRELLPENKHKFALVNYESCWSSYPSLISAWSHGARNIITPENSDSGQGCFSSQAIKTLLRAISKAEQLPEKLTDEFFDLQVMPEFIKKVFSLQMLKLKNVILSAFTLERKKISRFEIAFEKFSQELTELLLKDPVSIWKEFSRIREKTQEVDEYSIDLNSWLNELNKNSKHYEINTQELQETISEITILSEQTDDFKSKMSGISIFLPRADSTTFNSNWEKYLFSHRVYDLNGLRNKIFDGYVIPLPRPKTDKQAKEFPEEFKYLYNGWWKFGGLYSAIRETARLLTGSECNLELLTKKLHDELFFYGLSEYLNNQNVQKIPEELLSHKIKFQVSNKKDLYIKDSFFVDNVIQNVTIRHNGKNRGLGYLPAKKINSSQWELDNIDFSWYYAKDDSNKIYPLPTYEIRNNEILVPAIIENNIVLLLISFNGNEGSVIEYKPFYFTTKSTGRAVKKIHTGTKISFLGNLAEGVRYEKAFFYEEPAKFIISSVIYSDNLRFLKLNEKIENMEAKYYIRDIFSGKIDCDKI